MRQTARPQERVERTAAFVVGAFSLAMMLQIIVMQRRVKVAASFSDFFITVRLFPRCTELMEGKPRTATPAVRGTRQDVTPAFNRGHAFRRFYSTAWVLLPEPSADGHCIVVP